VKRVGIDELKARLFDYVRQVKAGQTMLVLERDEVVAELRPARRRRAPVNTHEEVLDTLAAAGDVTRARLPKGNWTWKVRGLGLSARTARRVLDHVRGDRSEE
jgi:antitoxin (DNA-binding transcriptional repressor) of toxin-antitoxin stability system